MREVIASISTEASDGLDRFLAGIDAGESVVKATYGALGGNVMVCGGHDREVFDDGMKAIQSVLPLDPVAREAVFFLRDAAVAQHSKVGDGTSTAILLTAALIRAGRKLRADGHSANYICQELDAFIAHCCDRIEDLKSIAVPESIVTKVATLAMHGNSDWGATIGSLVHKLGHSGSISFAPSKGSSMESVIRTGFVWNGGAVDDSMLTNGRMEMTNTLVFMINERVENIETEWWHAVIRGWKSECQRTGIRMGLLCVCQGAAGSVMSTFAGNPGWGIVKVPNNVNPVAFFEDLSMVVGGTVYDTLRGNMPEKFDQDGFGKICTSFWATRKHCCIVLEGDEDAEVAVADHTETLRAMYAADALRDDPASQAEFEARMAILGGGFGEIRVPYVSEVSFSATREILEDGFMAAKASLDGIVPGAGNALAYAAWDPTHPTRMLQESLSSVAMLAGARAGCGDEPWTVKNGRTKEVGNAIELGVIDGASVVISALRVAAAVAKQVVNTNVIIVREDVYSA